MKRLLLALWLMWSPAAADDHQNFRLSLPVACDLGETCFIQNHFDRDPGPGFRDHAGGVLGYDGHAGLDIRIADLPAMARGVAVIAAAAGRVRAVRDGMADVDVRQIDAAGIAGREAGNSVVIDHGGGWHTQSSHLRSGSVMVAPGDDVEIGDELGMIGMSGNATFPHVHFAVRRQDVATDPFGGAGVSMLWDEAAWTALAYTPSGVLAAGFAARSPQWREARRGDYAASMPGRGAPALVFWTSLFGGQAGDQILVRLIAPGGEVVAENRIELEKNKAQYFSFAGRKRRGDTWPEGVYGGEFKLYREIEGAPRELLSARRELTMPR